MICEPAPGSKVRDRAHEWRRDGVGEWTGCYGCDPAEVREWGWSEIIDDCDGARPVVIGPPRCETCDRALPCRHCD